ncbi:putative bifunctional diguanylate cyclase/phosphodiesterase [Sphingomonas qomolangmaensis]|uniref:GGDEF domain-containing response regulator n=1 Tax=Sphingomonas qomolangmaensis TaxID=2918765 RepID=A0ABY5LE58_9SPHN|nr:GGDEF domain-containing response regulator [Sphingomonas qomolangmaensis]UUL82996.1 GGDEF domain-containing response regulator [Sphingomonas qomolangmaensis]
MHARYRQCFGASDPADGTGSETDDDHLPEFELVHVDQGGDAVDLLSRADQDQFAVALIDVRASGVDGRETAAQLRAVDPDINLVIISDQVDTSPVEAFLVAGPPDKICFIAKPFEPPQIAQIAGVLGRRWSSDRMLAATRAELAAKTAELEAQQSELAELARQAMHVANHDPLTDAPNRQAFLRALEDQVATGDDFAMALIDLDRFKLVNDTFGHLAGDELVRQICAALRESAPEDGVVARLGGDEFAVLFAAPGEQVAAMICDRLLAACAANFKVFDHELQASASIGLVLVEGWQRPDPIDVMRRADLALNEAKRRGRGIIRLFDEAMDESIRFRRKIEGGLAQAIANDELRLVYQPIVERGDLEIVAFEALLRWDSPDYGTIPTGLFIPIAEESSLIHELGDWVLTQALEMLQRWPGQYVSVNFSPRQFRRQNFVAHVVERVQHAGIAPTRLQIEITETAIFDDAERAADTLYRLRQMGFRIALDDFGTGYSSLYNIRRFSLDCLKIDKSFIDGIGRERESAAIVQSIIHLARALGLEVVAEGVETPAQVQALRIAGCSHLQGYHLSRPLEAEDAAEMAQQRYMRPEVIKLAVPRVVAIEATGKPG